MLNTNTTLKIRSLGIDHMASVQNGASLTGKGETFSSGRNGDKDLNGLDLRCEPIKKVKSNLNLNILSEDLESHESHGLNKLHEIMFTEGHLCRHDLKSNL